MPPTARTRRLAAAAAALALVAAGALAGGATTPGPAGDGPAPTASGAPAEVRFSDAVRARAGAPIKLTAPTTASPAGRIRLSGAAVVRTSRGAPRPRPVRLSERRAGHWKVVARTRTTRSGAFRFRIASGKAARTRTFRAVATAYRGLSNLRTRSVKVKVTRAGTSSTGAAEPRAGDLIQPEPLRAGYVGEEPATDWAYIFAGGGRWDPCQVIRWSYNPTGQGYRALADVARAFAKISGVSGLRFQYVGTTGYRYLGGQSEANFPDTTDIVVSWAGAAQVPALAGSVVGLGGGTGYVAQTPGADVAVEIVRGHLTLDNGNDFGLPPGFDGSGWGQVMMHEILHALGLAHASHANQLMYGMATSHNFRFGAGDIRGMKRIGVAPGSSGCLASRPSR